jgi:hypothetical protein
MNDLKRIFGPALTILGVIVLLYACAAFLSDGKTIMGLSVTKGESAVPFILGLIFFAAGISLINNTPSSRQ